MRADAHYVDLIESLAPEGVKPRVPSALVQDDGPPATVGADPTLHAGQDLTKALATLSSCAALMSDAATDLARLVVGDLIRAEAWRASALVHATRVVRRELPVVRTAVAVAGVLDKVAQGFQPERRVRAVAIDVRSALPGGAVVVGDESLVSGALTWALLSSLAVLNGVDGGKLAVSAGPDQASGINVVVSQPTVTPPAIWQSRAFDVNWTDRPGGVAAVVWMLALQEVARVHGGSAHVERSDRGTAIRLNIPAGV